jgi:hypothetical protein
VSHSHHACGMPLAGLNSPVKRRRSCFVRGGSTGIQHQPHWQLSGKELMLSQKPTLNVLHVTLPHTRMPDTSRKSQGVVQHSINQAKSLAMLHGATLWHLPHGCCDNPPTNLAAGMLAVTRLRVSCHPSGHRGWIACGELLQQGIPCRAPCHASGPT